MPEYRFRNPKNNREISLFMSMNDNHEYYDIDGTKCERIWFSPQTAENLKIDAFSSQNFVDKTNKQGTIRDLWDRSHEYSEIRKQKMGVDPIREKHIKDWEKQNNKQYPSRRKENAIKKLDKLGVIVEN